jgi:transposase-like protein
MPQKGKIDIANKILIVEEYISGKIGIAEAERKYGIHRKTIYEWVRLYKTEGIQGMLPLEKARTYSRETKLAAVIDYLSGKRTASEICEIYKIRNERQLRNWIKVYNSHGEFRVFTGGSSMTKGRETTSAERIEIAKECIRKNNNYSEIAHKYQVSYQQVYTWVKKYHTMGEAGLEDRRGRRAGTLPSRTPEEELRDRIAQLERDKFNLEMENELLKKVKELERRRR